MPKRCAYIEYFLSLVMKAKNAYGY